MGFFKSKEEKAAIQEEKDRKRESKLTFMGCALQPIGKLQQGWAVELTLDPDEEKLHIRNQKSGIDITLPYDRLIGFKMEDETNLVQSGGTIGRALVGGLLFGGAGAIVGGMSGKGKTKTKWYGVLSYVDKNGEAQELVFEDMLSKKDKFITHTQFTTRVNQITTRYREDITEL